MPPALSVARRRCMLVRRRSSPAPAGRSEILRCRGDLATRNHHERGTAWAHPSIRDTGPDGRRLMKCATGNAMSALGPVYHRPAGAIVQLKLAPHGEGFALRLVNVRWMSFAMNCTQNVIEKIVVTSDL